MKNLFRYAKRIAIVTLLIGSPLLIALLYLTSNPCKKNLTFAESWAKHIAQVSDCAHRKNLQIDLQDLSLKVLGGCVDGSFMGRDPQELCEELVHSFEGSYPPDIMKDRWACRRGEFDPKIVEALCLQSLSRY